MNFAKILITLIAFQLLSAASFAQNASHIQLTKRQCDSLKKEIDIMVANDQKYRWMLTYGETDPQKLKEIRAMDEQSKAVRMQQARANKVGISQAKKDSLSRLQSEIDSVNFSKMSGIIYKYGVPECLEAYKVSLFFIHCSDLISDDFLSLLKQEVKDKHYPGLEYATIYDDVQTYRKLPELYYVSEYYNTTTKTSASKVPLDLAATNKARKEIGLKRLKK